MHEGPDLDEAHGREVAGWGELALALWDGGRGLLEGSGGYMGVLDVLREGAAGLATEGADIEGGGDLHDWQVLVTHRLNLNTGPVRSLCPRHLCVRQRETNRETERNGGREGVRAREKTDGVRERGRERKR